MTLQIENEITIEHEGITFVFSMCDIFDLVEAEERSKAGNFADAYLYFLQQLKSISGIKHGDQDVSADDVKSRTVKIPFTLISGAIRKLKNKIMFGTESPDVDGSEKNE